MSRRYCPDCGDLQSVCDELGGCDMPPCPPKCGHEWCEAGRRDRARELAEEHRVDAYLDRMRGA